MPERTDQNIAIIGVLDAGHLPLAFAKARAGYLVCFFHADNQILAHPDVKRYCSDGTFLNLSGRVFHHTLYNSAIASAGRNLDGVYDRYFRRSATIPVTVRLLDDPEIEDMYRKEILSILASFYFTELKINEFVAGRSGLIEFYPSELSEIHTSTFSLLAKQVKISRYTSLRIRTTGLFRYLREYTNYLYPLYILIRKVKWIPKNRSTRPKIFLAINANLPSLFTYNYHYIRFLVDEIYGIPKDRVLFVDEAFRREIPSEFADHGFSCMNFLQGRVTVSSGFLRRVLCSFFPAWLHCLVSGIRDEIPVMKMSRLILTDYIRWNLLAEIAEIKNHVTILLPDTVSKNLILTRQGVRTWYVYPDNYAADYHTGWDETVPCTILYAFMHADTAVVFGDKIRRYFSVNRNVFQQYAAIGVPAAQHVREIREGRAESPVGKMLNDKKMPSKIIGVFDTTFADNGPVKVKDGLQFGRDILQLLEEFPDIGIVFKEKKFISITPELAPVYRQLEAHPRCLVIRKTEQDCIFSSEVIAMSDLVISVVYTSTTAEALASRTRAIYYDVAGTDRGSNFYFNKFPNLVAHDYPELKTLVRYWLTCSDSAFDAFLDQQVKGEIDPYLDCHASDRLHALLRNP